MNYKNNMTMSPEDIKEIKNDALEKLNSFPNAGFYEAASIYVQCGLYLNDNTDAFYEVEEIEDLMAIVAHHAATGWIKYLNDEIGKPVVYDFDLWADSLNFAKGLLDALEINTEFNFELVEATQAIFVAVFRMWYEDITIDDVRNFLGDKPCQELPDMNDMRKTFLWAMENDIPCHDMTSLINNSNDFLENQTAEQEIEGYMDMAKLRDTFDNFSDSLVTMGIPQDYLDKNRLQLREAYYGAVTFYEMIPHTISVEELVNEHSDQMERFFGRYCDICTLNDQIPNFNELDEEEQHYYFLVFLFGLHTGEKIVEIDGDENALFRDAIENEMKRYKE